jgi:hypothetical protein
MNNALLVLFVVTGLILMLFWKEAVAAYRVSQAKQPSVGKRGFVRQISDHDKEMPEMAATQEEMEARFDADREKGKGSLIRDMANRSPWKDAPPSSEVAKSMSDDIDEVKVEHVGKRTVPSRDIEEVDRSDRSGEDAELTDRVAANVATQDVPKDMKDVLIDEMMAERKAKRDEFSDAVEGIGDLLDD